MDPIIPEPHGLIPSIGDFIGRLNQPIYNALTGRWESAGRQLVDLAGDVIDAPIPGDWIPHISRAEDFRKAHELVGIDPKESPALAAGADMAIDAATNPFTWAGGAAISGLGKGAQAAGRVIGKTELGAKALEQVDKGGQFVRRLTGNQRLHDPTRNIMVAAAGAKGATGEAARQVIEDLAKLPPGYDEALAEAFHGVRKATQGPARYEVVPGATLDERLARIAQDRQLDPGLLANAANKIRSVNEAWWETGKSKGFGGGIFHDVQQGHGPSPFPAEQLTDEQAAINELLNYGRNKDYLYREFTGIPSGTPGQGASSNMLKARSLKTPEEIADWLNSSAGAQADPVMSATKLMGKRAELQARAAQKAAVGRGIEEQYGMGPLPAGQKQFEALAAEGSNPRVLAILDDLRQTAPEDAQVLQDLYKGLEPRSPVEQWMASLNRIFKKFAVSGAVLPKLGTHISNLLSGAWQTKAGGGSFGELGQYAQNIPAMATNTLGRMARKATEGTALEGGVASAARSADELVSNLTGATIKPGELDAIEQAFRQSGGDIQKALELMPNDTAREAVRRGILGNNFVNSEELISKAPATGWSKIGQNLMDYPSVGMEAGEQNMRYGNFKRMMENEGVDADTAARESNRRFFNYDVSSTANRRARDFIPFFQFTSQAIPQAADALTRSTAGRGLAVALNDLGQSSAGNPIYPWMEGKTNIPLGQDEQGNQQYISGLRMPYESLSMIPNLSDDPLKAGREIEQNILGSTQPLLKTAISYVSGHDPYFQSTPGSYTKVPVFDESLGKTAGRAYHTLAGAGLIQPIDSTLRLIDQTIDPDKSLPVKALDLLTGANVVSVNPQKALMQEVQSQVERDPDIQRYETYLNMSKDPETQAKLQTLKELKKALKQQRLDAAKAAQGQTQTDGNAESVDLTTGQAHHADQVTPLKQRHHAAREDVGLPDPAQISGGESLDLRLIPDHLPADSWMWPDYKQRRTSWLIPQ